jgi:hypothetical protein
MDFQLMPTFRLRACLDLGAGPLVNEGQYVPCKWAPKAINKKVTYLHSLLSCVNLFKWGWGHLEATIIAVSTYS